MGCIIGDLKYIVKVADNIARSELQRLDNPILSQHIIIFHLIGDKTILFNDLQSSLQLSKSTLSDAINKYQELGLIDKIECPNDKRNLYVSLSKQGLDRLQQLVDIDQYIKRLLFKEFDHTRQSLIEQQIQQMSNNLKEYSVYK